MLQRQEKSTPFKPHQTSHLTGTKRSLYRDLENQFLASRRISDEDVGENKDPVIQGKRCESSAPADTEPVPVSVKSGQVSVIRKAPSSVPVSDASQPQKRPGHLTEVTDNRPDSGSCASPEKLSRRQVEQDARYASALALIQLAQGHS